MKKRVDITTGFYFPTSVMIFAVLLVFFSIVLLTDYAIVSLLLILLSLTIFTARYRLTINLIDQTYHDYLWIAGFKKGESGKFDRIAGMYITENAYRQTVNSRISSMVKYGTEYNGYIMFDDQQVHLLSNDSKKKVERKLEKIQRVLKGDIISSTQISINSEIVDHTKE